MQRNRDGVWESGLEMPRGDKRERDAEKVGRKKRSGPASDRMRKGDQGQGDGRRYGKAVDKHYWTGSKDKMEDGEDKRAMMRKGESMD